jgi:ADP-ribose pyrophosphatase
LKNRNLLQKNGYPNQPVVAVGAIVFRNNRVLLVRRGQAPSQDLWAIPGGRVELGETLQEAAEREILEETGITIRALDPVYTFDYIERDGSAPPRFHYVIVDLIAEYVRGETRAGDDAADVRWVSAEDLANLKVSSKTVRLLKKHYSFGC